MRKADSIPVLIADDHPLFRRGLRDVIEEDGRYAVVAECSSGDEVLDCVRRLQPRASILDIEMPRLGGLEAALLLRHHRVQTAMIFLTMHDTEPMFRRALALGALGYVLKDGAMSEIVQGIDSALRGDFFCSAPLAAIASRRSDLADEEPEPVTGLTKLTPAEQRVLLLIAEDRTTEEIADDLCVSPRTIDGHRAHISRKLGLTGTHSLLRFALLHRGRLPVSPQPVQRSRNGER